MAKKSIYFCIDPESYTEQLISHRGACGYYDYLQTNYAISKGISPMVVSNMAFFDIGLVDRGYDIYLCYGKKALKIEQDMTIPIAWAGKDEPKVIEEKVFCDHHGVYIERPDRYFPSLLEAFMVGVFHDALGVRPFKIEPKFKPCEICGNCGYFMRYAYSVHGKPAKDGDCGSIGMNKECYEGVNPFNSYATPILQVEENEEACGFFKVNRTKRVREYIKAHPNLYVQESVKSV